MTQVWKIIQLNLLIACNKNVMRFTNHYIFPIEGF